MVAMTSEIKIDGIYDDKIIKRLGSIGIKNFGFDFRPLSFNFIPQYKFQEIIDKEFILDRRFFLHFADEKDFMIWKIVNDLTKLYGHLSKKIENRVDYLTMQSNFFLEFSFLKNDLDFYNQFNLPFYIYFDSSSNSPEDFVKFSRPSYLKGIILNYNMLLQIYDRGEIETFKKGLLPIISNKNGMKKIEIILDVDWDSEIFAGILESFSFDNVSFKINSKIEFSYRNVDLNRVENHLRNFSITLTNN